ncbi:MAG TPA: hypothetical protein VIF62_20530, partial [Labilithrix sp.]
MGNKSLALGALVSLVVACGSSASSDDGATPSGGSPPGATAPVAPVAAGDHALVLTFGGDVLPAVRDRVTALVTNAAPLPVKTLDASQAPPALASDSIVLSFGDTTAAKGVVDPAALAKLGPEGLVVRSGTVAGATILAARGNAPDAATSNHGNLGTAFAAYAMLEELGFAFLHPLAPVAPTKIALPSHSIDIAESPAWRVRGMHLHSMHPLELTDMLQGFGPNGTDDEAGWNARLPEWDRFLEWMLANRQNRVEWVLLYADSWKDFADGTTRQNRFATLV